MTDSPDKPEDSKAANDPTASAAAPTWSHKAAVIWRRVGPAGPLAVVSMALPLLGEIALLFSLKWLAPWLRSHGDAGLVGYALVFAVTSGLAILPTHIQSLIGGWVFGLARGCSAAIAGVTGGALIGYFIARRASGDRVVALIEEHPKWRAVYNAMLGRGFWKSLFIVTLLRIPPSSPFAATNLVMASTRVPFTAYLIGSVLGLAPRTAAVVFVASQFQGIVGLDVRQIGARWLTIVTIVLSVVAVMVVGSMANRAIARVTAPEDAGPRESGVTEKAER